MRADGNGGAISTLSLDAVDFITDKLHRGWKDKSVADVYVRKFGVARRTAWRHIKRVKERIGRVGGTDPVFVSLRSEQLMLESITRARAEGDYRTVGVLAARLAELFGRTSAQRRELTGADGGPIKTTTEADAELLDRIARVQRGRSGADGGNEPGGTPQAPV